MNLQPVLQDLSQWDKVYFVDYENQCQNFLLNLKPDAPFGTTRDFKVFLFIKQDTKVPDEIIQLPFVQECRALTTSPEAADKLLTLKASHFISKFQNTLYLVKGSEKGYDELIAHIKGFGTIVVVDGANTHLLDSLQDYSCSECKVLFAKKWNAESHKKQTTQCNYCKKLSMKCQSSNCVKIQQWKRCQEAGCPFQGCDDFLKTHDANSLHPFCSFDKCGCKKPFLSLSALEMHYNRVREYPFGCAHCDARASQKPILIEHYRQRHSTECIKCEKCNLPLVDEKHKKNHRKNCKNPSI
jgi:hypothetical protein